MATLEELTSKQVAAVTNIQNLWRNYKKDSEERKTEEYVVQRIDRLDALWKQMLDTDDQITTQFATTNLDHEYFKEDYISQAEKIVKQYRGEFGIKLKKLQDQQLIPEDNNRDISEDNNSDIPEDNNRDIPKRTSLQNIRDNTEQELMRRKFDAKKRIINSNLNNLLEQLEGKKSKAYLTQKIKLLSDYWQTFAEAYENIVAISEEDINQYQLHEEFTHLEAQYQDVIIQLQEKLDGFDQQPVINQNKIDVRLPRLEIPHFYGDISKWVPFHDVFNKMINENHGLTNTHKINYLMSHVGGAAARLINHLPCSEDNYEAAWNILKSRYNNKRLIVSNQLNALLGQASLTTESASGIKSMHDTIIESMYAIKNLGIDTNNWDPIIVHVMLKKLDNETLRLYEASVNNPKELQTLKGLLTFLEGRFSALEAIQHQRTNRTTKPANCGGKPEVRTVHVTSGIRCGICGNQHFNSNCPKFRKMSTTERWQTINKLQSCPRCLSTRHGLDQCQSTLKCMICKGTHHTLLHQGTQQKTTATNQQPTEANTSNIQTNTVCQSTLRNNVILGTALVKAVAVNGREELLRVLIDTGSQASFITQRAAEKLRLRGKHIYTEVAGMGGVNSGVAHSKVKVTIQPRFPSTFSMEIEALVFEQLTKNLPDVDINAWKWEHINNLLWADPNYSESGPIDMLLGADYYSDIILGEVAKGGRGEPVAQHTELGWVIFGASNAISANNTITTLISSIEIDKQLEKFWEIEELQPKQELTEEEQECEEFYMKNHKRKTDGTYVVRIPFKTDTQQQILGESKRRATARLLQVENRLAKDPALCKQYHEFMKEYLALDHMTEISSAGDSPNQVSFYLPHHAVLKETSTTTKLRVVFDASAKTSTGVSLNDQMVAGPRLQENLDKILLKWRMHQFVFTADIEKMYRQIRVADEDQPYQRILWRFLRTEPIREFQLKTVTYGTTSAPYLAVRTLQQLARDEQTTYPRASKIVMTDFYVDDVMSGASSIAEAKNLQVELIQLLQSGGFNLRKWMSNSEAVLQNIPEASRAIKSLHIKGDDTIKALGIHWNPLSDTFEFKVNIPASTAAPLTKRKLLSEASKLFDPLGLLAPTIIQAKIMLQKLWLTKISWDEPLPSELNSKWTEYTKDLKKLETIRVPRWIHHTESTSIELHGFCDASEDGYGACVYSRTTPINGQTKTTLLTAKTRVAPIKTKLSLPRLELCGALLLARLMKQVQETMQLDKAPAYAWCDSTIVLAWINGSHNKFRTFVANRISKIQSLTQSTRWSHVRSKDNPADCASRGITPSQLCTHSLWWYGPKWLKLKHEEWPTEIRQPSPSTKDVELKKLIVTTAIVASPLCPLFERVNKLHKLQRIVAYVKRFINNSKKGKADREISRSITARELNEALSHIVRIVQGSDFHQEITHLKNNQSLSGKSKIISLNPFLDGNGLLRVGGRLQNSTLPYEEKHPIILLHGHLVTRMIIEEAHIRTLHGGPQLTLAYIRKQFWITNGRNCVRFIIQKCVKCHRFNTKKSHQLMGSLPEPRVTPSRPFSKTGVDYAGPLQIRATKGRGHKSYKGYIAIFVCLATKAIHIEIVSDQTTQAFIAAYKRFTARRGLCSDMYSDNGTNFIGANNQLLRDQQQRIHESNKEISELLAKDGTTWHFIPPTAPHFGGIWEAGVKSVKHHLKRVIGETTLTFEELSTVVCEIEACLNSRPISPMSDDPNDFTILTPGHFLIGDSLIAPPQPSLEGSPATSITRWKLVEKIAQDFWKKWNQDYLSTLQQRTKWLTPCPNVNIGELVLLKDDNLPPSKWLMGRITDVHPGSDGKVRVVSIRGPGNTLMKRPVTKISPLPSPEFENKVLPGTTTTTATSTRLSCMTGCINQNTPKRKMELPALASKQARRDEKSIEEEHSKHDEINTARHWMRGQHTENSKALAEELKRKIRPQRKKPNVIRPYVNPSLFLYTTAILCILFQPTSVQGVQPFETIPFDTQPGLYFEHAGHVNFINHQWNIVIYYNLTTFWDELTKFQQCIKHMKLICKATTEAQLSEDICIVFLNQLQIQLANIENSNIIIRDSNKDSHRIRKRGLINGVGYIANELFGVLDQRAAEKFENDIDQIRQNEHHLLMLMKNQTSITDASIKLFKANEEALHKQMNMFNDHLRQLEHYLNVSNKVAAQQNITDSVLVITLHATLIMIRYQQTQNIIIDMITDTHHGKIHPSLLTPAQLRNELRIITTHLPQATTIPETPTGGLTQLYNLMTVKMRVTDENIIFCVYLPLPGTERFQLFRIIPIPITHQNKSIIIQPNSEYLLVNSHRDRYYPMKRPELGNCFHAYTQQYLCKPHQVIHGAKSNESKCEMDFLNHKSDPIASCSLNIESPRKKWIPLSRLNSWIYSMDQESMMDVVCDGRVTPIKLAGQGVIQLQPSCSIQHEGVLITTLNEQTHAINMSFVPTVQLNHTLALHLDKIEFSQPQDFNFSTEWDELQQAIEKHQEELKLMKSINHHDIHHYVSIYVIILLILILGIGIIKYKGITQRKNKPIPAPRSRQRLQELSSIATSGNPSCFVIQTDEQVA